MTQYDVSYIDNEFNLAKCRESAASGYAAAQGNYGMALHNLGSYWETEFSVIAEDCLTQAARAGDMAAQYQLGEKFIHSFTAKVQEEGEKWLREAADQGYLMAISYAEYHYDEKARTAQSDGDGEAEKSYRELLEAYSKKAVDLCREMAEAGNADAQEELGERYYSGEGVPQDYAEAIKWFKKAGEQGNKAALIMLSRCYENGCGVEKDIAKATSWGYKARDVVQKEAQSQQERIQMLKAAADAKASETPPTDDAEFDMRADDEWYVLAIVQDYLHLLVYRCEEKMKKLDREMQDLNWRLNNAAKEERNGTV